MPKVKVTVRPSTRTKQALVHKQIQRQRRKLEKLTGDHYTNQSITVQPVKRFSNIQYMGGGGGADEEMKRAGMVLSKFEISS